MTMGWNEAHAKTSWANCAMFKGWVWQQQKQRLTAKTAILRARSRVPQVFMSLLSFMLCFVLVLWILAFTLSLVSDASPFSRMVLFVNCISPRNATPSANIFSSGCCSPTVLSSSTQSVSQILAYFTSRKRVFWGVVLIPPIGYSRPPSAVNDLSVTK